VVSHPNLTNDQTQLHDISLGSVKIDKALIFLIIRWNPLFVIHSNDFVTAATGLLSSTLPPLVNRVLYLICHPPPMQPPKSSTADIVLTLNHVQNLYNSALQARTKITKSLRL
jgi:hypothetical protein